MMEDTTAAKEQGRKLYHNPEDGAQIRAVRDRNAEQVDYGKIGISWKLNGYGCEDGLRIKDDSQFPG